MTEDGGNQRGRTRKSNGSSSLGSLSPRRPAIKKLPDPIKEWEKVKFAWWGRQEAWERYSGLKLPSSERR